MSDYGAAPARRLSFGKPLHLSSVSTSDQFDAIGAKLLTPKSGAHDDSIFKARTTFTKDNPGKFDFPVPADEARSNFYDRHASLENHRMRQGAVTGSNGVSSMTVVHTDLDDDFGLNSPVKPKTRNVLRRLRSKTMDEMGGSPAEPEKMFFSGEDELDGDYSNSTARKMSGGVHIPKRQLKADQKAVNVHDAVKQVQLSPRSKYINACLSEGMNARASLVLKRGKAHGRLNLAHQGLSDRMAVLFAHSIEDMTDVQAVCLTDNNLTDEGLPTVIKSLSCIQSLTQLDLSDNIVGDGSATALSQYFMLPHCQLKKLNLHNCGVDDDFVVTLMDGVFGSTVVSSLVDLDVSNNKLGKSESMNSVNQIGALFSRWLTREDCGLQNLNISWNMIRLESAANIGRALRDNTSLLCLDLSYNALGKEGGLEIGASLLYNTTLKRLLLAHNALDSMCTITICAGVVENTGIEEVVFDGNPIGHKGADAIMMIPVLLAGRVKVSAEQCNITVKDQACWFDFDKLPAKYMLNMENHFERAVAIFLLHLVAAHHTIVLQKVEHDAQNGFEVVVKPSSVGETEWVGALGKKRVGGKVVLNTIKTIELEAVKINREALLDSRQAAVAHKMRQMIAASGDTSGAIRLFEEVDLDHSGGIDMHELNALMVSLGIRLTDYRLRETMSKFDTDGTGFVEIGEFLKFLAEVHAENTQHLDDLINIPGMVLKRRLSTVSESAETEPEPEAPPVRWLPPTTGTLKMEVVDGFVLKKIYRTMASCDRYYLENVAKKTPDAEQMLTSSLKVTKIRFDDAVTVCTNMTRNHRSATSTLTKLLRQMSSVDHAREILANVIGGDRTDMAKCKREIGQYLKPIIGRPNGYYNLDLARESDRACVMALFGLSEAANHKKALKSPFGYGFTGDVSQKGNWSSFRNELYNGAPFVLDMHFLNSLPVSGRLQFDFSCVERPEPEDSVMQDAYLVKFLCQIGLIPESGIEEAIAQLVHVKNLSNNTLKGNGKVLYERPFKEALEMDIHHSLFYEHLAGRSEYMAKAIRLEDRLAGSPPTTSIIAVERTERGKSATRKSSSRPSTTVRSKGSKLPVINTINSVAEEETGMDSPTPDGSEEVSLTLQPLTMLLHQDETTQNGVSAPRTPCTGETLQKEQEWLTPSAEYLHFLEAEDADAGVVADTSGDDDDISSEESVDEEVNEVKEYLRDEEYTQGKERYGVRSRHNTEMISYVRELLNSDTASPEAKLKRFVDIVEETIGSFRAMHCRHIALILTCMEKLPFGLTDRTKYSGNYRVEVVVALVAHIVDMHNFELISRVLKPYESACVNARIGMLNFFNPLKCEGAYGLDLMRWDQRMVCKMLILLETHEPGENWARKQFRWTIDSEPFPGWVLTQAWLTEEGLPRRGILDVSYYSGEGRKKHGCVALPKFRKSLLFLTNIEEHEVVEEEHRHHSSVGSGMHDSVHNISTANYTVGLRAIKLEIELWQTYLIRETIGQGVDAVTAPRRVKKSPILGDANYSTIPVFRDRNNSKAVIAEGSEFMLPVAGSAQLKSPSEKHSTASYFISKLNEAKDEGVAAVGEAPLAELLTNSKAAGAVDPLRSPPNTGMPSLNESSFSPDKEPTASTSKKPYRNRSYGGAATISVSVNAADKKDPSATTTPYRNRSYAPKVSSSVDNNASFAPSRKAAVSTKEKTAEMTAPKKFRNRSIGVTPNSDQIQIAKKAALPAEATPIRSSKLGSFGSPFSPGGLKLSADSSSGSNSHNSNSGQSSLGDPYSTGSDSVEMARKKTLHLLGIKDGFGDVTTLPAAAASVRYEQENTSGWNNPPAAGGGAAAGGVGGGVGDDGGDDGDEMHAPPVVAPVIVTTRTPFNPMAAKSSFVIPDDSPPVDNDVPVIHAPPNIAPVVVDFHKAPAAKYLPPEIIKPKATSPKFHAPKDIADHAVIDPHVHAPPARQASGADLLASISIPEAAKLHAPKDISTHAVVDHHSKVPYRNKSYSSAPVSRANVAVKSPEASAGLHAPKDIAAVSTKAPYRNRSYGGKEVPSFMASTKSRGGATSER